MHENDHGKLGREVRAYVHVRARVRERGVGGGKTKKLKLLSKIVTFPAEVNQIRKSETAGNELVLGWLKSGVCFRLKKPG